MSERNGDETPLVSAILITHNRRDLVQKAIESVLRQSYAAMELIVVDDASSDGTKELLEARATQDGFRYLYIPASQSRGGNHARNVGLQAARGAYLAFLDDDDEWLPEKTAKQAAFLNEHPDYGVVSCLRIFEKNFSERVCERPEDQIEGDIRSAVFTKIHFVTSTLMLRREVFDACGAFDEALRFWQEYELSIRYAQVTKVGCVREHLCLYRILLTDKNRLTNRLDGWMDAVAYIEDKHSALLAALPPEIRRAHKEMIARDGLNRAETGRDYRRARRFYWMLFQARPSARNLVKALLGLRAISFFKSLRA